MLTCGGDKSIWGDAALGNLLQPREEANRENSSLNEEIGKVVYGYSIFLRLLAKGRAQLHKIFVGKFAWGLA